MNGFEQQLGEFSTYFGAVAQISGGLLGLVFVALTFNPQRLALRHDIAMRSLAQQVFADFLMVMVIGLLLLIPHTAAGQISLLLIVTAGVGIVRIARSVFALRREMSSRSMILQRFWLSLIGHAGILAAGCLLWSGGNLDALWSALLMSPLVLLIAGARSAWLLVMHSVE